MKMLNLTAAVAAISVISGCATVQESAPEYQQGKFPDLGVRTTVYVGQVMVSEYDYVSQDRAVLRGNVSGSFWVGRQGVGNGANLVGAMAGGVKVYCVPPGMQGMPCLKDSSGDGRFDTAYVMNAFGMVVSPSKIDPVNYDVRDQNIQDGFKYELVYQGVSDNTMRVAYREYTDNLARPAFHQDLSYNMDEGDTSIRFRNVSMTVESADNNEVTYVVNSGF